MNREVKQYADSGDRKSLKYIFVDSLDVDPTFVRYEEEYNYCKSIPGLLENHVELTPFTDNKADWTEDYWTSLKMDLLKNFSDQRMTHMRKVAKVVLADKLQRILKEREAAQRQEPSHAQAAPVRNISESTAVGAQPEQRPVEHAKSLTRKQGPKAAEQARQLEDAKRKLKEENLATEAERKRREDERKLKQSVGQQSYSREDAHHQDGGGVSKKAIGVAAAVAVAAVVLVLLLK